MTFNWQGRTYDTSVMKAIETGNPAMPVIYVGSGDEVFAIEIDRVEGVEVRLMERDEAHQLAERHGFQKLIKGNGTGLPEQICPARSQCLIVEDDGFSRHALSRLLRLSGYEIKCAATVAEADPQLSEKPRWLILDLNLPDGKGIALLERVRAEGLPIKVAITTGETDQAVLVEVSRLHPDAIFHKPLDISEVMHWLAAA